MLEKEYSRGFWELILLYFLSYMFIYVVVYITFHLMFFKTLMQYRISIFNGINCFPKEAE
jgi:hypothetical protein